MNRIGVLRRSGKMDGKRTSWLLLTMLAMTVLVIGACAQPTPETIIQTQVVTVEKTVEVVRTVVVEKEGETIVVTATPTPLVAGRDVGTVRVLGPYRGAEEAAFLDMVALFEEQNPDIDVLYSTSAEFERLIDARIRAGDPPDVAVFAEPSVIARLARRGYLAPLWNEALAVYEEQYTSAWEDLASVNGTPYGFFHRVDAKGWVWYNKPAWEAAGWVVPTTWDELMALTEEMKASDIAPWCDGIESGAATGWKGIDWIENLLLRTQPVEVYDAWVAHELPFSSDEVRSAFEILDGLWKQPGMTYGGPQTIALSNFQDPAEWLFGNSPRCWMHMQRSIVTHYFPADVRADLDEQVGVFMLPPIDEESPLTLQVEGEQYVVFKAHDREEVRRFIEFLGTPESVQPWAEAGGSLFPHVNQDTDWYPTELERTMVEAITGATAARFDCSEGMPPEVILAFRKGITDWISLSLTLDEVLADIDAAFP
jgi:alpha-glucoside transport system substrate-binding protein